MLKCFKNHVCSTPKVKCSRNNSDWNSSLMLRLKKQKCHCQHMMISAKVDCFSILILGIEDGFQTELFRLHFLYYIHDFCDGLLVFETLQHGILVNEGTSPPGHQICTRAKLPLPQNLYMLSNSWLPVWDWLEVLRAVTSIMRADEIMSHYNF